MTNFRKLYWRNNWEITDVIWSIKRVIEAILFIGYRNFPISPWIQTVNFTCHSYNRLFYRRNRGYIILPWPKQLFIIFHFLNTNKKMPPSDHRTGWRVRTAVLYLLTVKQDTTTRRDPGHSGQHTTLLSPTPPSELLSGLRRFFYNSYVIE